MQCRSLTTISPSMATVGADMRREMVRLGAIFPPPPLSAPALCFISTELPSTAPSFRQAQQFPMLVSCGIYSIGLSGSLLLCYYSPDCAIACTCMAIPPDRK